MDITTKTLENTDENIKMLESIGYVKSSVSKPYNKNSVLRYSEKRRVYFFSSKRAAHDCDCAIVRSSVRSLYIF